MKALIVCSEISCMLNFGKYHKVSSKWLCVLNHLVVTLGLANFVLSLSFRLGLGFLFMAPSGEESGGHVIFTCCQK